LTSRFSRAARRTRSLNTGSWKVSHQAASGSISEGEVEANFVGSSTVVFKTGVLQPVNTSVIDAASAATATRPDNRSARRKSFCSSASGIGTVEGSECIGVDSFEFEVSSA
jgi:hypothetical protein